MNHTKEPWHVEGYGQMNRITDGKETVGYIDPIIRARPKIDDVAEGEANAKRIVACVNACAGITDAVIEAGIIKKALIAYLGSYDKGMTWNNMKVWEDV